MKRSFNVCTLILVLILISVLFASCGEGPVIATLETSEPTLAVESSFPEDQRLRLMVVPGEGKNCFSATPDTRHIYYSADSINCAGIKDAFIEIDGETMPLEDTMAKDLITTDELEAWARVDAKRGYCTMEYASHNGLSKYAYIYDKFIITTTYDVYESPNGKQYHDQFIAIHSYGHYVPVEFSADRVPRIMENGEYLYDIDREDWGVEFEVLEASPAHLKMRCTQSGGQHWGQLQVLACSILRKDGLRYKQVLDDRYFTCTFGDITIENEGITEFAVTWPEANGQLPPGDYCLDLSLKDRYDEASVPSLIRNYTDQQSYSIPFTVQGP